ncbi:phosphoglycerate dehydrogenase-like enzyme [Labedella gwakjiensis]|nr:phosphoglycerate dehydrogenase-like enzyme [Labedella gwakjiensis]
MGDAAYSDLFDAGLAARLSALLDLRVPPRVSELSSPSTRSRLAEIEVLVTGWGAPPIDQDVLDAAPALRAVFHTGGSVKSLMTQAAWDRGIVVTSAAEANAIPVAEFALATILLEGKRARQYARGLREHRDGDDSWRRHVPPAVNYRGTVGLVGFSRVGRRVAELLRPFDLRVLVFDPVVDPGAVAASGATSVDLETLARRSDIVSLHAPELPETRGIVGRRFLSLLADDSVLINTARGGLVDQDALVAECASGRLRAVLDVTEPEPLPADHPFYTLPTVELTPHIAGSMHAETHRMTESALGEIDRYVRGLPLRHAIDGRALGVLA